MELEQYFTPPKLARRMVEWAWDGANPPRATHVLEPSAGAGAIVRAIPKNLILTAMDIDPPMVERLRAIRRPSGYHVIEGDFRRHRVPRKAYDIAIMNPPYGDGQDGAHVAKAARICPRVVALVRANFVWGSDRYYDVFRWCRLTRVAVLVKRPNYLDVNGELHGLGARHDFVVIELVRRDGDRLAKTGEFENPVDEVATEWWIDNWNNAAA